MRREDKSSALPMLRVTVADSVGRRRGHHTDLSRIMDSSSSKVMKNQEQQQPYSSSSSSSHGAPHQQQVIVQQQTTPMVSNNSNFSPTHKNQNHTRTSTTTDDDNHLKQHHHHHHQHQPQPAQHHNAIIRSPSPLPPPTMTRAASAGAAAGATATSIPTTSAVTSSSTSSSATAAAARESWSKALKRVLKHSGSGNVHSKKKPYSKNVIADDDDDPLGDALTRVLNQQPAFCGGEGPSNPKVSLQQQQHEFLYPPILSRHNWRVARTRLRALWQLLSWRQIIPRITQACNSNNNNGLSPLSSSSGPLPPQEKQRRRRSLLSSTVRAVFLWQALLCLVLCLLLLVVLTWSAQGLVQTWSAILSVLIDVKDVEVCYIFLHGMEFWRATCRVLQWMDCYILRGIRFQGREWNDQTGFFCTLLSSNNNNNNRIITSTTAGAAAAAAAAAGSCRRSDETKLWDLPPPTVQVELDNGETTTTRLCLADRNELRKIKYASELTTANRWGADTLDHVVAIDFCYVMLRDSRLAEKQKIQKKRREKTSGGTRHHSLTAASSGLLMPQHEEEEEDEEDEQNDDERTRRRRRHGHAKHNNHHNRNRPRSHSDSSILSGQSSSCPVSHPGSNVNVIQREEASNAVVTFISHNHVIRQVPSDHHSAGEDGNGGSGDGNGEPQEVASPTEAIELKVFSSEHDDSLRMDPSAEAQKSWPDDELTDKNDDDQNYDSSNLSDDGDNDGDLPYDSQDRENSDNVSSSRSHDDSGSLRSTPNRRGARRRGRRLYAGDMTSDDEDGEFSPGSSTRGDRTTGGASSTSSDAGGDDRPWLDVGAEIGMKLLNSAHVHRAVASQETQERFIMGATSTLLLNRSSKKKELTSSNVRDHNSDSPHNHHGTDGGSVTSGALSAPGAAAAAAQVMLAKPIHPMWTSPGAAMSTFRDDESSSDHSSYVPTYSTFGSPPASPRFSLPSLSSTPQHRQDQRQTQAQTPKHESAAATPASQDERAWPPLSPKMVSPGIISHVLRRRPSQDNDLLQKQRITVQQDQQHPPSPVPSISTWSSWSPSRHKRELAMPQPLQPPYSPKSEAEEAKTGGSSLRSTPGSALTRLSPRPGSGPFPDGDNHFGINPSPLHLTEDDFRCVSIPPMTPRKPLAPGVKVAVPIIPDQPTFKFSFSSSKRFVNYLVYQMGTVVSSKRIFVGDKNNTATINESDVGHEAQELHVASTSTNCLSVTVKLEKSFLRNGEFANLTFRVMDCWSDRFMPKHSKVPIGACIATSFGIGVLVGWRVEDDCHVVRSLWNRRGAGAASGYLNRNAIHGVVEAALGFRVQTTLGRGETLAYVDGGPTFENGHYLVSLKEENRHKGRVVEVNRNDILSCHGAQFIPVIEYIREAAHFQIQLDNYQAAIREQEALGKDESEAVWNDSTWQIWSEGAEIMWSSFLQAVEEDKDFDAGVNAFMMSVINFLERLDGDSPADERDKDADKPNSDVVVHSDFEVECVACGQGLPLTVGKGQEPAFWIMNDFLGGIFNPPDSKPTSPIRVVEPIAFAFEQEDIDVDRTIYYDRAFAILRTLMKTVSFARASTVDNHHFRLGLAVFYDFLLFVRTIVKVLRKNDSRHSMDVWNRALDEISSTFGPIKERLEKIGQGIAQRMEKQGRRAKTRVLTFVDTLLGDERLILALEQGDWEKTAMRLELALMKAKIIEKENIVYYRKAAGFIYSHLQLAVSSDGGAAMRNNEKLVLFAKAVQWLASPRRSILKIFERDDVLDFFERILVRVFQKEEVASRMLVIHASNFHSLRHLRMLKDVSTSGRLWMPVLDAADEELSWVVSQLPENTKEVMLPLASLFSLCVAGFHNIDAGDLSIDWMDFLLDDEAVQIIHNIDMKLILALEAFSRDVKEMMLVLPYYSSIDDDILNLMDEVDLDQFLREASDAMDDQEKLAQFVRAKVTFAIERFLNYLPRMSIPVEKRDLVDGWVLTCRGEDGGDLTLSDVTVKRENLVCQIMGGDALFFPMFGDDASDTASVGSSVVAPPSPRSKPAVIEESVLDHIREMLLEAQRNGCWKSGVGGIGQPPSDRYVATALQGLPVSAVLNCGIELWRNLEIDDDELLEIAIRDVSFQIRLQKEREEAIAEGRTVYDFEDPRPGLSHATTGSSLDRKVNEGFSSSFDNIRRRFNPRVDPTVLFLEMRNLTLHLDKFLFRIEKNEKRTILDPVFEGKGTLTIKNVSIRIRIECAKERARQNSGDTDPFVPVLLLRELTTSVENVRLKVKDTGFGSDWLLNKAVDAFADDITKVVEDNLRDQIQEQAQKALDGLNSYFLVNPNMLLNLLGISMDDLEDNVVWV